MILDWFKNNFLLGNNINVTVFFNIATAIYFILFVINSKYAYSLDQKCIISNGVPSHEIAEFPTKVNPNKFNFSIGVFWIK